MPTSHAQPSTLHAAGCTLSPAHTRPGFAQGERSRGHGGEGRSSLTHNPIIPHTPIPAIKVCMLAVVCAECAKKSQCLWGFYELVFCLCWQNVYYDDSIRGSISGGLASKMAEMGVFGRQWHTGTPCPPAPGVVPCRPYGLASRLPRLDLRLSGVLCYTV